MQPPYKGFTFLQILPRQQFLSTIPGWKWKCSTAAKKKQGWICKQIHPCFTREEPGLGAYEVNDPHLRPRSLDIICVDGLHAPVQVWEIDYEPRRDVERVGSRGQPPVLDNVVLLIESRAVPCLDMITRRSGNGRPGPGHCARVKRYVVLRCEQCRRDQSGGRGCGGRCRRPAM